MAENSLISFMKQFPMITGVAQCNTVQSLHWMYHIMSAHSKNNLCQISSTAADLIITHHFINIKINILLTCITDWLLYPSWLPVTVQNDS